jgi:uncharacterized membrane protein YhaH (DUF805 family)
MRLPRLRRRHFWALSTLAWGVFFAVRDVLMLEQQPMLDTAWAGLVLLAAGTLAAARLHDRGRSAAWLGALIVPVAGALWLAAELALRRGDAFANAYGPDPRAP